MKTWEKPQLIVLARGNPEEAILTTCKTGEFTFVSGPHWEWNGCYFNYDYAGTAGCYVDTCSTPANS